jgi:hypothetical protein
MYMRFGMWNAIGLHWAGSLEAVARELSKYYKKSDGGIISGK